MKNRYCITGNVKDIREIYYDVKKAGTNDILSKFLLFNRKIFIIFKIEPFLLLKRDHSEANYTGKPKLKMN